VGDGLIDADWEQETESNKTSIEMSFRMRPNALS
jgi:hypothetical protein